MNARELRWVALYVLLALAPLLLSLIQLDPGRGFWVNLSIAAGFVGLALMGLQFALAARWSRTSTPIGIDVVLQFHKEITALAVVLILAHPVILFVWDTRFLGLLDLPTAPWRARFAVISVALLLVLVATSVWRRRMHLGYAAWQALHNVLAVVVVVTALAHVLLIGYYVDQPWERGLWIAYTTAFIWIGLWVRVVRPLRRWRHRWRVVEVREEPGSSHTVVLVPATDRPGAGLRFLPGQFAWIHTGRSPFALTYHPFSFSSSAESHDRVEFTIKTAGAFTGHVGDLPVGRSVYLDGPWGSFSCDIEDGPGFVFVSGGIGVTPTLSMLRTLADRGDRRPCLAIVANRDEASMTCADALAALLPRLDLTVVHVLSEPGAGWTGEHGRIDPAMLDRLLPADRAQRQYFLCASPAMMDAVEEHLSTVGVPGDRIHSERFTMV